MEMMKRKMFKVAIISSLVALIALAVSVTVSSASSKGELPEYLGSKACLGCHAEKFTDWDLTGHAHMVTQVFKLSDLPGAVDTAPQELQDELSKAAWMVAGHRFLARDPKDGALKYLNVQWDATKGQYVAYKGGSNWETSCAGCHSTGWDEQAAVFAEPGIGCEMCHGPGRDHVLGKGDISKITATNDAQACGQCHTGGQMPNGERWVADYKPGEDLHATGFEFPNVPDPHEALYPDPKKVKQRQYPQWAASAHANAITSLEAGSYTQERCYACHAASAFEDKLAGKPTPTEHQIYDAAVSCSACHDPHVNNNEGQLRAPKEELCITCHTASLAEGKTFTPGKEVHHPMAEMLEGRGAIDVAPTLGAHSELTCVECHMTEGNHLMRVIKPSEVAGTTRQDTCTTCHSDSSAESRAMYLEMWQESTERRVNAARNDIAVISANQSALSPELKAKFDAAKTNLSFVEADASKGVHNFEYSIKVLTSVQKSLSDIRTAIGK